MRIRINDRLRPFSHTPGTFCLLPYTSLCFQIFPALIRVHDLQHTEPKWVQDVTLDISAPITKFTVEQDLESGWIRVWGRSAKGFFRYRIIPGEQWGIFVEKEPDGGLHFDDAVILKDLPEPLPSMERFSFGCHKAQDWDLITRRCDMIEVFPFWLRLSEMLPEVERAQGGVVSLLESCKEVDISSLVDAFRNVFLAGFEGILSPRLKDLQYHGFNLSEPSGSALWLLKEGGRMIRSLFINCQEDTIAILPTVPPQCHCGRILNVGCHAATFDIEWTKKHLRRMIAYSETDGELLLALPKGIRHFRMRRTQGEKGTVVKAGMPISVEKGECYFLDHFED